MHLLYPARLVLSWYLNITFIYAINHLVLPLSLSAFKYISFTSFASMVASRLKLELGASGLHVSSTEKPRCSIWPLQQPSSRNKREQNWNTLSKINRFISEFNWYKLEISFDDPQWASARDIGCSELLSLDFSGNITMGFWLWIEKDWFTIKLNS